MSTTDTKRSNVGIGLEGLGGVALVRNTPSMTLGYHNLYHGTSSRIADKIKEVGFDPKYGGTGAAKHHGSSHFKENSSGKIHFTKSKATANMFAGFTQSGEDNPFAKSNEVHFREGIRNMFFPKKGKVLKARVDHGFWERMDADPDMGNRKNSAATTREKVPTTNIVGGKNDRGIRQFLSKDNLKKYWSSKSGLKRGLTGVGLGLTGTALLAHSAKGARDNYNISKSTANNKYLEKAAELYEIDL